MTIKFANRVKVNSSTTGTGSITLGSAVESFQTFSEGGILDGNTVRYTIVEVNAWEVGTGVYTHSGTILSRTLEESSTGSLLNLTGEQEVFITTSATDIENLGNRSIDYFYFTATAGQTAFTGNDDSSNQLAFYEDNVLVFMNGIVLEGSGQDYTVTGGNTITLTTGASVSDEINVVAFKSFTVADAVPKSTGGQFDANVDFAAGIDVTGNITVTGTVDGRDVAVDGTKLDGIEAGANDYQHPANHPISVITGLQTALDGKVDDGQVLTDVPSGAVFTDTTYSVGDGGLTQVNFTTADNTKLDGIEAGATADQTKADIDALNVDADTLDGQHGAYYTGYTDTAVANLVDSSPGTLDTLNELAAALGDDPNFATTTATNISTKVSKAGDTMTGNLSFGDNDKAIFGAGSDLQIYHDGTDTFINETNASGWLYLQASNLAIRSAEFEYFIDCNANSSVDLYYDGSKKLATTSTGIDVTGTVKADGLTVDGNILLPQVTPYITAVANLAIDIDSDNNNIGASFHLTHDGATKSIFKAEESGDISFYEDTGTTAKFFWDASAESLGIGTTNPSSLDAVANDLVVGGGTGNKGLTVFSGTDSTGAVLFADGNDGTVAEYRGWMSYDHSTDALRFASASAERMRIDSSGRVGIGTSSPNAATLHTYSNADNNYVAKFEQDHATGWGVLIDTDGTANDPALWVKNATDTIIWAAQSGRVGIGTSSPIGKLDVSDGSNPLSIDSSTYNEIQSYNRPLLLNRQGNNVGIGTASPSNSLHVSSSSANSVVSYFNNTDTSNGNGILVRGGGSNSGKYVASFQDASANTRMQILSNGNVGIGTSSPSEELEIASSSPTIRLTDTNDSTHGAVSYNVGALFLTGDQTVRFNTDDTERMRIDSSGNLLVGNTLAPTTLASASATQGVSVNGTVGYLVAAASGTATAYFNRQSSDGDIVQFRKDGSTVGSIGSSNGDLMLGNSDVGLKFHDANNTIYPWNVSSDAASDGQLDLGAGAIRFKDLYLSGKITNDGTGGIQIDTSGNVGIGTDSPSNALEVSGWAESRQGVIAVTDFSSPTGTNVTTTNATGVAATEKTVTKRGGGQSQFVYHVVLSHESDGSATNINGFFRPQYQINSGGWVYDNRVITVGGQGDQSGGTNNNAFTMTFNFTNAQLSKGDTLTLRIVFNKNANQSVYFNQQSLSSQPSGTSNYCSGYIMEIGEA